MCMPRGPPPPPPPPVEAAFEWFSGLGSFVGDWWYAFCPISQPLKLQFQLSIRWMDLTDQLVLTDRLYARTHPLSHAHPHERAVLADRLPCLQTQHHLLNRRLRPDPARDKSVVLRRQAYTRGITGRDFHDSARAGARVVVCCAVLCCAVLWSVQCCRRLAAGCCYAGGRISAGVAAAARCWPRVLAPSWLRAHIPPSLAPLHHSLPAIHAVRAVRGGGGRHDGLPAAVLPLVPPAWPPAGVATHPPHPTPERRLSCPFLPGCTNTRVNYPMFHTGMFNAATLVWNLRNPCTAAAACLWHNQARAGGRVGRGGSVDACRCDRSLMARMHAVAANR